jgi:hypothetical protein
MPNQQDLSLLAAYPGKYLMALFTKFFSSFDVRSDVTTYTNIKSKINLTKLQINDGPRPYTGDFAPVTGDLQYIPNVLTVEKFQRDIKIKPDEYRGTFMEELLGKGSNAKNKNFPFAQFVWETVLTAQAEALNNRTAYFGVGTAAFAAYNPATAYTVGSRIAYASAVRTDYYICVTATTAGQTPETHPAKWKKQNAEAITVGFGKKIADAITGNNLVPVTTGAINSTDAYDQFTEVWRGLPEVIKIKGGKMYASVNSVEMLQDAFENQISKYTETDNSGRLFLSKTNKKCEIVPASWMSGSGRLIATPKENMIMGCDQFGDENMIDTKPEFYAVLATMSSVLGFGIRDFENMSVNDQA